MRVGVLKKPRPLRRSVCSKNKGAFDADRDGRERMVYMARKRVPYGISQVLVSVGVSVSVGVGFGSGSGDDDCIGDP